MQNWYSFSRGVVGSFLRGFFGFKVTGEEHVPLKGGLLIMANHLSFLDPPVVAVAMPREIHFLARKTLFKSNGFGNLITSLNSIPIDKDRPDMNGLRLVIRRCQEGSPVLVFPESTRSPDGNLQPGQAGAGLVAVKAGVPILPVRISGTFEAWSRNQKMIHPHPLHVAFGPPFQIPQAEKGDKEVYQKAADQIMSHISKITLPEF